MSRPERWWRPSTNRRPASRRVRRQAFTGRDVDDAFDVGYRAGQADAAQRRQDRDEQLRRAADALRAADAGDPSLMDQMAREYGMTPPDRTGDAVDGDQMINELETWLRQQNGETL
ncbi:hypothetical protein Vqi01_06560 [Micromonospora qiuiae]|uniref:Uncharacterized protein n=1 Tax=Micromonospora qiuiae TaxID=502268 RepID=A0ABQ4J5Q0_9ACTN|nr:hypothetical protein [Micromonospora qiuiae]GIJ25494.1 hypothetical protein Vqi01_06560 [Micromonospora qiuiae]